MKPQTHNLDNPRDLKFCQIARRLTGRPASTCMAIARAKVSAEKKRELFRAALVGYAMAVDFRLQVETLAPLVRRKRRGGAR